METSVLENKQGSGKPEIQRTEIQKVAVKIQKLSHYNGEAPSYQTALASGFDVRAQITEAITLEPGAKAMVPTALSFEIPAGYEIQARPRSGLAAKHGLTVLNSPGTIDADFRGEVKIILINLSSEPFVIQPSERIAQLVLAPVYQADFQWVDSLGETSRGAGGFGSTGRR
jgi:dUTP pyrophosphatase